MPVLSRLVVSLVTETAQFDRGMQTATRTLGTFDDSTKSMNRGLTMAQSAIRSMGAEALGVQGPLGNLGAGLLMFGVGGVYTTAFIAGFLAMRKVMDLWGAELKERQEQIGKFIEDNQKLTRTPFEDLTQKIAEARGALVDAGPNQLESLRGILAALVDQQNEMIRASAAWNAQLRIAVALYREIASTPPLSQSGLNIVGRPFGFGRFGEGVPPGMVGVGGGRVLAQTNPNLLPTMGPSMSLFAALASNPTFQRALGEQGGRRRPGLSGTDFAMAGIGALQGAIGGGGVGALVSGGLSIGGAAIGATFGAAGGPIGSAIGGLLGTIIGELFRKDKPMPVRDEALLAELRRYKGPEYVSINLITSGGDRQSILAELKRAERLDGVGRVPNQSRGPNLQQFPEQGY